MRTEFVFNPADDETVDDEYVLIRNPSITIQCCDYGAVYAVNEHGGEGERFWSKTHGFFRSLNAAKKKALQVA